MAFQAIYDFLNNHSFHVDQLLDKAAIQGKIFPNRLLQMPTRVIKV